MDTGIEQGKPRNALGGGAYHLQRHPGAHRVADRNQRTRLQGERRACHVFQAVELRKVGDGYICVRLQRCNLCRPDGCVTEETGKKDDLHGTIPCTPEPKLKIMHPTHASGKSAIQ
jgi:hypothetical protein